MDSDELQLPPVEEVEEALDLSEADRDDLPGLYRFNTRRVPRARTVGLNLLVLVALAHNALVFGEVEAVPFLALVAFVEAYCIATWLAMRAWFQPLGRRGVHLGDLFLFTDYIVFDAVLWVTGGTQSLLWPVFIARIADQLWIHRARGRVMAVLGPVAYAALLVLWVASGHPIDWGVEATKMAGLIALGAYLILLSSDGWEIQRRTLQAKEWILRLEEQSRQLDVARREAEKANRAKSEFLARMSHELRTPLNSVVGFTNVLLKNRSLSLGSKELDYLQRIRLNAMHLMGLIDDILDISRVEEGRVEVRRAGVDLATLVDETVRQLEGRALDRDIELVVAIPDGLPRVLADEVRLRQVLINLVGNALKFTPEGRVEVSVETAADGAPAAIHVRDTGPGIPENRLEAIFEPFEQVDGSTGRRHFGAGLGLPIARSFCELMGFTLSVESVVGQGSTFSVRIPPEAVERDSSAAPALSGSGRGA
ncbi:MAG: hypothetical protein D6701_08695 [Gemmatimonadetes bacterium]|nr:MAG: hypothetical protein D6701_08695 [Gemmatimonadota bacterium]